MVIDFLAEAKDLQAFGNDYAEPRLTVRIPEAKRLFTEGMTAFCGTPLWLTEYDDVIEWMTDSKGKGLFLMGNCGVGKTVICSKILPVLLHRFYDLIVHTYTALDMNLNTDKVLEGRIKVIDDIGTEGAKVDFGEHRMIFAELVDRAERKGDFLILTSNLDPNEIRARYGERTLDRLHAVTRLITIKGRSRR